MYTVYSDKKIENYVQTWKTKMGSDDFSAFTGAPCGPIIYTVVAWTSGQGGCALSKTIMIQTCEFTLIVL